ncbi:MAG: hypothetical protein ABMA64_38455, partial [Myxococcota bacterium]
MITLLLLGCSTNSSTAPTAASGTGSVPDDERDQYLIAHELGHAVMMKRSGGGVSTPACTCAGSCDGGDNLQRKYQAQAMVEGLGRWYGVITWNEKAGGACEWWNVQDLNFDLNVSVDYPINSSLPCWGDPDTTAPDHTDGQDWLSDVISAGAGGCGGSSTNRGTEYDWVHYGWGLYAYGSDNVADDGDELTAAQIVDIWVAAAPTTWDATGATTPTDSTDDPWGR